MKKSTCIAFEIVYLAHCVNFYLATFVLIASARHLITSGLIPLAGILCPLGEGKTTE
jgi:hypothetical protein